MMKFDEPLNVVCQKRIVVEGEDALVLEDPVLDPQVRADAILAYWKKKLDEKVNWFNERKDMAMHCISSALKDPLCPDTRNIQGWDGELSSYIVEIKKIQREYDRAKENAEEIVPAATFLQKEQDQKNRAETQNLLDQVKKIAL